MSFYKKIQNQKANGIKSLAILIDPDGIKSNDVKFTIDLAQAHSVDFFLVGGSLLIEDELDETINAIKEISDKPIVLFPGNEMQLHEGADAILFLSLISGRNPEYLISKHVVAAPRLKHMNIEVIPTGYVLVHGQKQSSASYISNTNPIPMDKPEITAATALAGQYLGHKFTYLEGGSGANRPISSETIKAVSQSVDIPIIVGGGIKSSQQMKEIYRSGADVQVIGTAVERRPELLKEFALAKKEFNHQIESI